MAYDDSASILAKSTGDLNNGSNSLIDKTLNTWNQNLIYCFGFIESVCRGTLEYRNIYDGLDYSNTILATKIWPYPISDNGIHAFGPTIRTRGYDLDDRTNH